MKDVFVMVIWFYFSGFSTPGAGKGHKMVSRGANQPKTRFQLKLPVDPQNLTENLTDPWFKTLLFVNKMTQNTFLCTDEMKSPVFDSILQRVFSIVF